MTGHTRHVALLHPPSHRPWPVRRLRRGARAAVRISRHEYERLRNAADLLDAVASLIRDLLPNRD